MGTDLWECKCVARDDRTGTVKIAVKKIYMDDTPPSANRSFCMMLLVDFLQEWESVRNRARRWNDPPEKLPNQNTPPLWDELEGQLYPDQDWYTEHHSAFIAETAYDAKSSTVTITPTHPGWTVQCNFKKDFSMRSRAYDVDDQKFFAKHRDKTAAEPIAPIDRSKKPEPEADPNAGFEMRIPHRRHNREEFRVDEFDEYLPRKKKVPFPTCSDFRYMAEPINKSKFGSLENMPLLFTSLEDESRVGTVVKDFGGGRSAESTNKMKGVVVVMEDRDNPDLDCTTKKVAYKSILGRARLMKPFSRLKLSTTKIKNKK